VSRITRRIKGTEIIEFVDGRGFANLSHEETVRLLFKTLAETEDKLENSDVKRAYFKLEDWLNTDCKEKPVEVQAAILWGGLMVLHNCGAFEWDEARNLFGEFMSKKMNLR
jgi:hypothetical protein